MAINPVSRERVLSALAKFDSELRGAAEWRDWQSNLSYHYALEDGGKRYPPKQIVSMATGTPVSDFSGGEETNTYLTERAFKIVEIRRRTPGEVSSVWRVTGPPENFITALTRRFWAVNENHERTWDRLETGDVLILHSTQQSAYAVDGRSTVIGFAKVGSERYRKSGLWWIQEIEQDKNLWPFAFALDAIVLFRDLTGHVDLSRPIEQKTREQRIQEATFLAQSGIPVHQLNQLANRRSPEFPNFPVNGSISHLHDVYADLVLRAPSDDGLFVIGGDDAISDVEQDLLSDDEKSAIDEAPLEKVRRDAEAFKDSAGQQHEFGMRRIRKENVAQKRRVARLESFTCQVCAFHCEYRNSKGKRRYVIHVDHILEKAGGGGEKMANLWVLCPNCHAKKTFGVITIDLARQQVKEAGALIAIRDNHLFV